MIMVALAVMDKVATRAHVPPDILERLVTHVSSDQ